jgi:hypothetical protein
MIAQKSTDQMLKDLFDITPEERARRNDALSKALDSLLEGDAKEQRETFEYLKEALDADRPSDRKLFSK